MNVGRDERGAGAPSVPKLASDPGVGHLYGTAFRGAITGFLGHYGHAAGSEVVSKIDARYRAFVQPNHVSLGILASRKYPYAFVGELLRTMHTTVRAADEDAFIRQLGRWGVDATLDTVERVLIRYLVSPQAVAQRAPELWRIFHDCGRLTILKLTDTEFHSEVADWPHHDIRVCKLAVEGGRRLVERSGKTNVDAGRTKCQAWGHPTCVTRIKWT